MPRRQEVRRPCNARGIFMTHIRTRDEPYRAQQWRLLWSEDGGESFRIVHESTDATNPPAIETDANANIYLARPDFSDGNSYLYRFAAADDYAEPRVAFVNAASAARPERGAAVPVARCLLRRHTVRRVDHAEAWRLPVLGHPRDEVARRRRDVADAHRRAVAAAGSVR